MNYTKVILRKGKEESLARRHPWLFSGAIDRIEGETEEGDVVDIYTSRGDFAARGHIQIGSITIRILTFDKDEAIDQTWWNARVGDAFRVRKSLGLADSTATTCYRLIHGEGDNLPGLVVDIYGTVAVVQCHSVGMYLSREMIAEAIRATYGEHIGAIYDKSSQTVPFNAGLDAQDGYLWGSREAESPVMENGKRFLVNWEHGQKTGFFIDQRMNRELVEKYSQGRTVLNTFSYTGGFSVYALSGGAVRVDSVDSSQRAVELAAENSLVNFGSSAPHRTLAQDAFEFLREMPKDEYDLIILDPPAFAKHHKVLGNATQGYKRLNVAAFSKIKSGGILFTFSCSQAVSKELFRTTVFSAAAISGRKVRILHQLTQPADHPVNIYHPEGEYLKGLVLYVE